MSPAIRFVAGAGRNGARPFASPMQEGSLAVRQPRRLPLPRTGEGRGGGSCRRQPSVKACAQAVHPHPQPSIGRGGARVRSGEGRKVAAARDPSATPFGLLGMRGFGGRLCSLASHHVKQAVGVGGVVPEGRRRPNAHPAPPDEDVFGFRGVDQRFVSLF
jgi:hypothetical protein